MSKQLSAELLAQIEQEAEDYGEKTGDEITGHYRTHQDRMFGYEEGATKYAIELTEAQERIKQLEDVVKGIKETAADCEDARDFVKWTMEQCDKALTPNNTNK